MGQSLPYPSPRSHLPHSCLCGFACQGRLLRGVAEPGLCVASLLLGHAGLSQCAGTLPAFLRAPALLPSSARGMRAPAAAAELSRVCAWPRSSGPPERGTPRGFPGFCWRRCYHRPDHVCAWTVGVSSRVGVAGPRARHGGVTCLGGLEKGLPSVRQLLYHPRRSGQTLANMPSWEQLPSWVSPGRPVSVPRSGGGAFSVGNGRPRVRPMVACRVAVPTLQPAGPDRQGEWLGCRDGHW